MHADIIQENNLKTHTK